MGVCRALERFWEALKYCLNCYPERALPKPGYVILTCPDQVVIGEENRYMPRRLRFCERAVNAVSRALQIDNELYAQCPVPRVVEHEDGVDLGPFRHIPRVDWGRRGAEGGYARVRSVEVVGDEDVLEAVLLRYMTAILAFPADDENCFVGFSE